MQPDTGVQPGLVSADAYANLGLTAQPFAPEIADGEWFSDDATHEQLVDIKETLINGDDLLLITGVKGAGKSVLLKQLSASGGTRVQCFSVRGSERFSTSNLFSGMLEAFKLKPPTELEAILKDVIPCLQALAERNMLGVIVLDDAERVSPQELSTLIGSMQYLNSNSGEDTLLRMLIAAEPEFETLLPKLLPSSADLAYATMSIEPFDIGRSAAYLNHRIKKASNFTELPFSEHQLRKICEVGGGQPAGLNEAAANELNMLYRAPAASASTVAELPTPVAEIIEKPPVLQNAPLKYAIGVLGVGLVMTSLYMFVMPDTADDVSQGDYEVLPKQAVTPVTKKSEPERIALVQEPEAAILPQTNSQAEPANAELLTSTQPLTQQPVDSVDDAAAPSEPVQEAETSTSDTKQEPIAQATKTETVPEPEKASTEPKPAATSTNDKTTQPSTSVEAQTQNNSALALESANWVLVQNPELYTVQMSASQERNSVEEFLGRSKLKAPNSIFSFKRGERTWYALVHGLYPTITEARAAIEKMPATAKSNQPWIRAISQIQNAVKSQ